MACSRVTHSSPRRRTARRGDEEAARRRRAAPAAKLRRELCREGEGAGLGVERVEGSEEMLHPRGIEPRLTVGGESGRRRELGGGTNGGGGLGFEGERGRGSTRIRRRVREEGRGGTGCEDCRHVARLTRMAGGGATRARGAERNRGEGEGETDVWARLGIFFFFSFFSRAVTTLPPLRKSRPEI